MSCSNWSNKFSEGHQTSFIPSGVKDEHLEELFLGNNLPGFEEPFACGHIVPSHIGSRVSHCSKSETFWVPLAGNTNHFSDSPHLGNGSQAMLVHHACSAYRTIYVPKDLVIHKACVVPNHEEPHNHPILPPTKTPVAIIEIYRKCVKNSGIVGSTVRSVDNGEVQLFYSEDICLRGILAQTTKITLGRSPSIYAPTLQNNRIKQDIIREEKKKSYPCGTDLPGTYLPYNFLLLFLNDLLLLGVIYLMNKDLNKPVNERYVHGFATTIHGGRILLTANSYLLTRIHHAKTIFVDTTFKRTAGALKEWEVVMYDKEVERGMSVTGLYSISDSESLTIISIS